LAACTRRPSGSYWKSRPLSPDAFTRSLTSPRVSKAYLRPRAAWTAAGLSESRVSVVQSTFSDGRDQWETGACSDHALSSRLSLCSALHSPVRRASALETQSRRGWRCHSLDTTARRRGVRRASILYGRKPVEECHL